MSLVAVLPGLRHKNGVALVLLSGSCFCKGGASELVERPLPARRAILRPEIPGLPTFEQVVCPLAITECKGSVRN